MTPPIFHIGDEVRVIGPSRNGECRFNQAKFEIDMIWRHEKEGFLFAELAEMKDTYTEDGRYEAKTICDIKERLCVLEGERPEVCECKQPLSHIASLAAMASFGPVPECVAAFIRHESEEAEKRKRDCKPNDELILISIQRGEEMHTDAIQCPAEAIAWCEKVLDSMRSDKP